MPDSPSLYNPRDLRRLVANQNQNQPRSPLQGILPLPDSPHQVGPLNMGTVL